MIYANQVSFRGYPRFCYIMLERGGGVGEDPGNDIMYTSGKWKLVGKSKFMPGVSTPWWIST